MNYIDHTFRELMLANPSRLTLTTGTAETLYPITNLYNGRPGVPCRIVPVGNAVIIDIDLGSALDVKEIFMFGTNLETVTNNAIRLQGGVAEPPVDTSEYADPWNDATLDSQSDFFGKTFLYSIKFSPDVSKRYWRITLDQTAIKADYAQIGEIWIELNGNHSWYTAPQHSDDVNFSVPVIDSLIDRGMNTVSRGMRIATRNNYTVNRAGGVSNMEARLHGRPLMVIEDDPASTTELSTVIQMLDGRGWRQSEIVQRIYQTFEGDGKY